MLFISFKNIYIYIYIILHALVEIYDIFRIFKIMIIILIVEYMHILRNKTKLDFGSAINFFDFNREENLNLNLLSANISSDNIRSPCAWHAQACAHAKMLMKWRRDSNES